MTSKSDPASICDPKEHHKDYTTEGCSIMQITFTCDAYTSIGFCFFTKLYMIINLALTAYLINQCFIYIKHRKVPV